MTLDRYWINVPVLIVSFIFNVVVNIFLLEAGYGLLGIASGTAASFALYGGLSYFLALKEFANAKMALSICAQVYFIVAIFFIGIFAIDHFVNIEGPITNTAVKILALGAFSVPFLFWLQKKTGVLAEIKRVVMAKLKGGEDKS